MKFFDKKLSLITYVMAGDPTLDASEAALDACLDAGADALEIGMPFTDPVADGPTIQAAAARALANRTTLIDVIALAARMRAKTRVPIILMGYLNPILAMGPERFYGACANAGISAVLVADLPADHASLLAPHAAAANVALPLLVAPTSDAARIDRIAAAASGFLYYVSVTGTTGVRRSLPPDLASRLALVRSRTQLPVVVGFGIQSREQVLELAPHVDGIVVGSAIVERAREPARVKEFVASLS
jgi:tryptophan synthase alpha chain